jgi:hypothetical protein
VKILREATLSPITRTSQPAAARTGYFASSCRTSPPAPAISAETTSEPRSPVVAGDPTRAAALVAIGGDTCRSCGARLAPDQRYCVECGQPRAATRLPSFPPPDSPDPPPAAPPPGPARRPPAWKSPNTSAFAVVGAVLLAIGVGVLIGRSDGSTSPSPAAAARVTTVVLAGPGASVPTVAPAATPTAAARGTTGTTAAAGTKKADATKAAPAKTAVPKVVKVGSAGTGPGYQKGKFTGNFFGGGG